MKAVDESYYYSVKAVFSSSFSLFGCFNYSIFHSQIANINDR